MAGDWQREKEREGTTFDSLTSFLAESWEEETIFSSLSFCGRLSEVGRREGGEEGREGTNGLFVEDLEKGGDVLSLLQGTKDTLWILIVLFLLHDLTVGDLLVDLSQLLLRRFSRPSVSFVRPPRLSSPSCWPLRNRGRERREEERRQTRKRGAQPVDVGAETLQLCREVGDLLRPL